MSAFYNRERAKQLIDFNGLKYKNKDCTDIDYMMEVNGKLFIFGEVKTKGKELPTGQRLMFEHLCKAIYPIPVIVFIAEHEVINPDDDIVLKDCKVVKYYHINKWHDDCNISFSEAVECFLCQNGFQNLIED